MAIPGTARDALTLARPILGADSEGNPLGGSTPLPGTFRGTYGHPTSHEQQLAAERNQQLDAICTIPLGCSVQIGDVATLRGHTYVVIGVKDVIQHLRVYLRQTG